MITRACTATFQDVLEIAREIVSRFHPRKVILFGSYAWGKPTRESDVDLLLVMDTNAPPVRVAAQISAAIQHPFPLDIVVYRPSDWDEYVREKASFAVQVLAKGKVLHEEGHKRVGQEGRRRLAGGTKRAAIIPARLGGRRLSRPAMR